LATVVMVETAAPVGPALKLTPMAGLVVRVATVAVLSLAPGALGAWVVTAVLALHRAKAAAQAVAAVAAATVAMAVNRPMAQMETVARAATVVLAAMALLARTELS
jgi:hypothetical protein